MTPAEAMALAAEAADRAMAEPIGAPDPDDFGFDASSLVGAGLSPEAAAAIEKSLAETLSETACGRVAVSGARLEGAVLHVTVTMPRKVAEEWGLVPESVVLDVTAEGVVQK